MEVIVAEAACLGSGQCELFCPEVFEVEEVARVRMARPDPTLHDAVLDAAHACPAQAIQVIE